MNSTSLVPVGFTIFYVAAGVTVPHSTNELGPPLARINSIDSKTPENENNNNNIQTKWHIMETHNRILNIIAESKSVFTYSVLQSAITFELDSMSDINILGNECCIVVHRLSNVQ